MALKTVDWIYISVFVTTGVLSALGQQIEVYSGAGSEVSGLIFIPSYAGMVFAVFFNFDTKQGPRHKLRDLPPVIHVKLAVSSLLNFAGTATGILGLEYAGSGVYVVMYSSICIWTALLRRAYLNVSMKMIQWIAVFSLTFGMALCSDDEWSTDKSYGLWGVLFSMASVALNAVNYVFVEKMLREHSAFQPSCAQMTFVTGFYCTLISLLIVGFHTIPHWKEDVLQQIASHGGQTSTIFAWYIGIMVSMMFHQLAWSYTIDMFGGTSVGIMQAMRAVVVFGIGHWAWCPVHADQCLTPRKCTASILVVGSAVLYCTAEQLVLVTRQSSKKLAMDESEIEPVLSKAYTAP